MSELGSARHEVALELAKLILTGSLAGNDLERNTQKVSDAYAAAYSAVRKAEVKGAE